MKRATLAHRTVRGFRLLTILALALSFVSHPSSRAVSADEGTVTAEDARRAALAWLHVCPDFAGEEPAPLDISPGGLLELQAPESEGPLAYVLMIEPRGFVVVTPNYDLHPIIAYSTDSVFDATESPENTLLHLLRSDLSERLKGLSAGDISPTYRADARALWTSYLQLVDDQGNVQTELAPSQPLWDVEHGPFLSSVWGQDRDGAIPANAVFNYYTPPGPDGDADNYYCGCVATALGQILNYYEWPVSGVGSHSYAWNATTLSADFGTTTYDWANVLDDYTGAGTTLNQRQAAGLVTYHAGVAVEMDYTPTGSGADTADVADALEHHLRFSGEWVQNTGSAFYDRLYTNIVAHRPAELAIQDTQPPNTGGHAIVVDGVQHDYSGDTTRYYHLNMGWDGYSNAWYNIEEPFTTGSYTWDTKRGAVMDIVPTPDLVDPGTTTTDSTFPVSWEVSIHQEATRYELQQAFFPIALGSYLDGAESGTGDWTIDGYWAQSANFRYQGAYSFHGQIYQGGVWQYPGTLTLDQMVRIDALTAISYYWGAYYGLNQELRLEISRDGVTWSTLKSHTDSQDSLTWTLATVTPAELSAYVGEPVSLRFVIDYLGNGIYIGSAPGFYVDEFTVSDARFASWTTVDDQIPAESTSVTVTENGDYAYRVRAFSADWWNWSDVEEITVSGLYASTTTDNWHTGSTWDAGTVPGATDSAIVRPGHTVTVDIDADCHDLTIESGGVLIVPDGVTLTVLDDLVNHGTLQQTQDVKGDNDVGFFNTGGYGGVTINASGLGDLGSTVVTIRGHQDCTTEPGETVRRCFDIAPANPSGRNATVTFFFDDSELSGNTCDILSAFHWGAGWDILTLDASYGVSGRDCIAAPRSLRAVNVASFSPFTLKDAAPTAVGLREIRTGYPSAALGLSAALVLSAGLLALVHVGAVRRRRQPH